MTEPFKKLGEDYTVMDGNGSGTYHVNGKHNCLGRFTRHGWEIYRDMGAPVEVIGSTNTLIIRKHDTKPIDWDNFRTLMKEHHKIDLSEIPYPNGGH